MKRIVLVSACVTSLLCASPAMATGIGPYFGYNHSKMSGIDVDNAGSTDFTFNHYVFGFALDTCTSADRLFNYRLNIGFSVADLKASAGGGSQSTTGYGFDMKHTFGFGIFRNHIVRVWAGPAIGLYVDAFTPDWPDVDAVAAVGGGAGPVVGANFHITGFLSVAVSTGYMYNYSAVLASFTNQQDSEAYTGSEHRFFLQVTPLFTFGRDRDAWR